jgi:hypothetical protein
MSAKVTFVDRDKGFKALLQKIKGALGTRQGIRLKVGVLGPAATAIHKDPSGTVVTTARRKKSAETVVAIASKHEFGFGRIPERSFIRRAYDSHVDEYRRVMEYAANKVIAGEFPPRVAMEAIGQSIQSDIQRTIELGVPPPLTEKTLEMRRERGMDSTKPLIATGQLKNSITYLVIE